MSAENGKKLFKKICATCHTSDKGDAHKNGPNLWNVYGRKSASATGYSYSTAFKAKGVTWTNAELKEYLEDPKKYVPGTKKVFSGVKEESDRMDIIAFLQSLK